MSQFQLEEEIRDLKRRILLLETTQPMGYSSVSEGRSRFVGNESILVQGSGKVEGWWIVTGTQRVTGRLEGSGTFDWTGPLFIRGVTTIDGELSVEGPWEFTGDGAITGDVDIDGNFRLRGIGTLENNLVVTNDGKIIIGGMTIDPNLSGGGVQFSNGATIVQSGNGLHVSYAGSAVNMFDGSAHLTNGVHSVAVNGSGVVLSGALPTYTEGDVPVGTLRRLPDGRVAERA